MTNCTRCGEPKDVHDAGENYACQASPGLTFVEEGESVERVARAIASKANATCVTPRDYGWRSWVDEARAAILAMTNAREGNRE